MWRLAGLSGITQRAELLRFCEWILKGGGVAATARGPGRGPCPPFSTTSYRYGLATANNHHEGAGQKRTEGCTTPDATMSKTK